MKCALLGLLLCVLPTAASANLTKQQLDDVALAPPAGSAVPLDLTFHDLSNQSISLKAAMAGRPTVLLPVDFTCAQLCSPAYSILTGALAGTGLAAGSDYRLIVVGIDARDTTADASHFVAGQGTPPGTSILRGDPAAIHELTAAIGYRFESDPANDAVAHPAAFVTLTSGGRVSRVLSSLAINPTDLRLALIDAGEGQIGGWTSRLALLCYGFDAAHGIYTNRIMRSLQLSGALFVLLVAATLAYALRRGGRPRVAR